MLEDSNAREILSPQSVDFVIFPIAHGTVKLSGGDQVFPKIHLDTGSSRSEELRDDLRRESDGSQPLDTMTDDSEARNDFWSVGGKHLYRHHVEPGVQLYAPKEESFPIPPRYTVTW